MENFNYDLLLSNFYNEKEVVNEVLKVYLEKVKSQIIKINEAIETKDFEIIRQESHSIKGSSYNITAKIMGDISLNLESSAKNKDINNCILYFQQLKKEFDNIEKIIQKNIF